MALDTKSIVGGAATATQIRASYEPLNMKTSDYEYCVIDFIKGILQVAGIDDNPTFTRSIIVNTSEDINNVLAAAEYLSEDYITRKLLTILGDGDQADDIIEEKDAEAIDSMNAAEEYAEEEPAEEETTEEEDFASMLEDLLEDIENGG